MTGTEDLEEPAEPETFAFLVDSLSHIADLLGELDAFLRSGHPVATSSPSSCDTAATRIRASPPAT